MAELTHLFMDMENAVINVTNSWKNKCFAFNDVWLMKYSLWLWLSGMDMLKHGESAYPADAWVEQQYMKEDALSGGVSTFVFQPLLT